MENESLIGQPPSESLIDEPWSDSLSCQTPSGSLIVQPPDGSLIGQPQSQISLSLTSSYARSWGLWEGLRELVQNWHDGVYDALDHLITHGQVS